MEREPRYFEYGEAEVAYLAARDPRLGEAMAVIGRIEREVHPDLFAALVNCIVGQQIATKAQTTIWNRMLERFGEVTPEAMAACSDDELQQVGISFRKVGYIKGAAARVLSGEVDLEGLAELSDDEVCRTLSALPGIGVWTAEMLMTFSMQRPNILSWGDLAYIAACAWCTTTGASRPSCSRSTAAATRLTARWPASIYGRWPAAPYPA